MIGDRKHSNIVERLYELRDRNSHKLAYSFVGSDSEVVSELTYARLVERAEVVASVLLEICKPGDRAALLFAGGEDFTIAFFGCLIAGVIAVPGYPVRMPGSSTQPARNLGQLIPILLNCLPKVILTTKQVAERQGEFVAGIPELGGAHWIAVEELDCEVRMPRQPISNNAVAWLQYTSGSTSAPKGVMVGHDNVMATLRDLDIGWDHAGESAMVTWIPVYHDMGLIYGILQPIYGGFPCYSLMPASVLQKPLLWLKAISKFRGTHGAAPNFAFNLCVSRIPEQALDDLDLSSWRVCLNGSEPVRSATIEAFTSKFARCGLGPQAIRPGYGLAEATLKVSAVGVGEPLCVLRLDAKSLENNRVVLAEKDTTRPSLSIVGCGSSKIGADIRIVEPTKGVEVGGNEIGEIWVKSASIAKGYWNNEAASRAMFGAQLQGHDGPFLRTGDLGFLRDGELFITGRVRDLIIVRGRNLYPQDIEATIEDAHVAVRAGRCAAFAIDHGEEERLIVMAEVDRVQRHNLDVEGVFETLRGAIAERHDVTMHDIVLVRTGTVPLTSSGKVQRSKAKQEYLDGTCQTVAAMLAHPSLASKAKAVRAEGTVRENSGATLRSWLIDFVASTIETPRGRIRVDIPFQKLGLDSIKIVEMTADLEDFLGTDLSPTIVFDYPTIEKLASHLAKTANIYPTQLSMSSSRPVPLPEPRVAELQLMEDENERGNRRIAVVGLDCRFPEANGKDAFWHLLQNGGQALSVPSKDRWPTEKTSDDVGALKMGLLRDIFRFDAAFFGISDTEASQMDPQQRLVLETAWRALEHSGHTKLDLADTSVGVFIGAVSQDYVQQAIYHGQKLDPQSATGVLRTMIANRLSYFLNISGPSLTIDTACSSSLIAVHLAIQSLRSGESFIALAGGANVILSPRMSEALIEAGMLALDGASKVFDESADGYVRGEGCGIVVLKRLSDALRDKDRILAILEGSASNHGGLSNGLTAPSGLAQQKLWQASLRDSHVSANQLGYIECHGTGTALGDPIELGAIVHTRRMACQGSADTTLAPCFVGSVKANIGHLEAAAGIAGLIKAVLCVENGLIPPQPNVRRINPHIDLLGGALEVPKVIAPWPDSATRRFAAVSSFGIGGSNCHIVIGQGPTRPKTDACQPSKPKILKLSGASRDAVRRIAVHYAEYLAHNDADVDSLCDVANAERADLAWRAAAVGANSADLRSALENIAKEGRISLPPSRARVVFMFPGQGVPFGRSVQGLYDNYLAFKQAFDHCEAFVNRYSGWSLKRVLLDGGTNIEENTELLQPALLVFGYAITKTFEAVGVIPWAVIGHSIGEFGAMVAAGVLCIEDALRLVIERARLMKLASPGGAMLAVRGEWNAIAHLLNQRDDFTVAAFNSPHDVVLSGRDAAMEAIAKVLERSDFVCSRIGVSHAFHCEQMRPAAEAFAKFIAQEAINFRKTTIRFASTLRGTLLDDSEFSGQYLASHIIEPVQFRKAFTALTDLHESLVFLDIGPGNMMTRLARSNLRDVVEHAVIDANSASGDLLQMTNSLMELHAAGASIRPEIIISSRSGRSGSVPLYPFDDKEFRVALPQSLPLSTQTLQQPLGPGLSASLKRLQWVDAYSSNGPRSRHQEEQLTDEPVGSTNDAARAAVLRTLANVGTFPERSIRLNQRLGMELGLDSLMRKSLFVQLKRIFPDRSLGSFCVNTTVAEIMSRCGVDVGREPNVTEMGQRRFSAPTNRKSIWFGGGVYGDYERMRDLLRTTTRTAPYFKQREGANSNRIEIGGHSFVNFSSYNYLGLASHPEVIDAVCSAAHRYGSSASASRVLSGQISLHAELEAAIADFLGVEDAIVYVSGHGTNTSTISHMMGDGDLILHDEQSHNSLIIGAATSLARRQAFSHNNLNALDNTLRALRPHYRQVLIVIEGAYSMDGDYPDLRGFVEIKNRYDARLYVDEAHSIGVMGETGRGICEHVNIEPAEVDVLMGTLSKAFAGCGGYVAGRRDLIEFLRYTSPAFIFSAGLAPSLAAASLAALRVLNREPQRVKRLQDNVRRLIGALSSVGIRTSDGVGQTPIVPILVGNSEAALRLSDLLFERGVNAEPIIYPAVDNSAARLRLFVTSEHTADDFVAVASALQDGLGARLMARP